MHKNKVKDMTRSILPSRARKMARFKKKSANKKNRIAVRQLLNSSSKDELLLEEDDLVMQIHKSDETRLDNLRYLKQERREADHLNHFVRWCEKVTNHLPDDAIKEKYSLVSSLIGGPSDLIKEHALGHFISDFNPYSYSRKRSYWNLPKGINGSGCGAFDRIAFTKAIYQAFEECPSQLNKVVKLTNSYWGNCRDSDPCMVSKEVKAIRYLFKNEHGTTCCWNYLPPSYQEGSLVIQEIVEIKKEHQTNICNNRVLLSNPADIEKLISKIFSWTDTYIDRYRFDYYGSFNGLTQNIANFLINKKFLEKR